jgi:hypothetical protein
MPLMQIVLPQDSHQSISFKIMWTGFWPCGQGKWWSSLIRKPKENIIHSSTFASEENRCGGGECQTINGWNESRMVHSTITNSYWVTCHEPMT